MKQLLLSLIAIASLTGCDAAETNKPASLKLDEPTWAKVRGGIEVRRFTNVEPFRVEQLKTNSIVCVTTEYMERVYQMPIQVVRWFNDVSNIWETVESPLLPQPRLLSETLRTNVVTNRK